LRSVEFVNHWPASSPRATFDWKQVRSAVVSTTAQFGSTAFMLL